DLHLFFFSSRRRHTRFSRDWSSDVCSSDLYVPAFLVQLGHPSGRLPLHFKDLCWLEDEVVNRLEARMTELTPVPDPLAQFVEIKIGRASCRGGGSSAGAGLGCR